MGVTQQLVWSVVGGVSSNIGMVAGWWVLE